MILWYHFGFMIISLALLGFALAGAVLHAKQQKKSGETASPGMGNLLAAGLTLPWVIVITRIPLDPTRLIEDVFSSLLFCLVILLTTIPFFLLGYSLCLALDRGKHSIDRVYGFSFVGGAFGVGLALTGMEALGGGGGVALAALVAWIGGATGPRAGFRPLAVTLLALGTIAASLIFVPGILPESSRKHFPKVPASQVISREWNAFSSVLFYENPEHHGLWALSPRYQGPLPEMLGIAIDEWAVTSIVRFNGDLSKLRFFNAYPPTLGLVTAEKGFEALVLGAGGGLDVLAALYFGAGKVQAVELNPLIVDAVKGKYRDYSGGIYHDERVNVSVAEGRHFIENDGRLYDRIIITGVDTFAATAAGAYALAENFIYTREAFQTYLQRLKPDGVVAMCRWFYDPPRQTLRLISAARNALIQEGVSDPDACFFVARAELQSLILVKRNPFTAQEKEKLIAGLSPRNAEVVYSRGMQGHPVLERFFTDEGRAELEASYPYRIDAPRDDCPFLFEHTRWRHLFAAEQDWFMNRLGGLEVLFITLIALGLFFIVGSMLIRWFFGGPLPSAVSENLFDRALIFFAFFSLGAGYLTAEAVLLPKLCLPLGHPVYAMSLVLVGLLIFSGSGSFCSRRLPDHSVFLVFLCLAIAIVLPLFFHLGLDLIHRNLLHAAFFPKLGMLLALLAVPGFMMGLPFPLAIRKFSSKNRSLVARAFLSNGVGSALAGPFAMALAITLGFDRTFWIAGGFYAVAGILMATVFFRSKMRP
ncbi:MAG: hypothetical protein KJ645_08385 [Planctomycetes bacterium]|nr:hypothetical protein [Planctomycetota bacterium]